MLAKRMQVVFCLQVRFMRFFGCGKQANPNRLVVDLDFGKPLAVFLANAWKAAFVVFALAVLCVLGVCRLAQIGNTVVRSVAVNVVKLMRRPFAMNVQPRQSMRGVQYVIKPNADVSVFHAATRSIARPTATTRLVPCKNARVGVIVDDFPQTGLSHLFGIHDLNNIKQAMRCQA